MFAERRAVEQEVLEEQFRKLGIDLIRVQTDKPWLHALKRFFELRERRRTRR